MNKYLKPTTQSKKIRSHTWTKDYSGSANFLPTSNVENKANSLLISENKLQIWRIHANEPIPLTTDPMSFYTPLWSIRKNPKKPVRAPGFPAKQTSSCFPRDLTEKTTSWICLETLVKRSCNLLIKTQSWLPFELVKHVTHHVHY